jgi:very-short-patch-repair endonuclease
MPTGLAPDSPFETAVIKMLRNHNWEVHPQVGCSGYRIDIGVVDPRARGRYLVGIECDGRTYHSGATARDRDRLRQHVLEGLGWHIHRIWSTDWWLNPEGEVKKILERLQALMVEEEQATEKNLETHKQVETLTEALRPVAENAEPASVALPIFAPITLGVRGPDAFYEFRSSIQIKEQMMQVIEGEGPISEAALFRKIARAWGLERTGSRIVERLKALVPASFSKTHEGSNTFYWPGTALPASLNHFRVANDNPASRRHVDEVCMAELSALVLQVLQQAGSTPRQDLARTVCRLVGMSTATAPAVARVVLAIRGLRDTLKVIDTDEKIRLPS